MENLHRRGGLGSVGFPSKSYIVHTDMMMRNSVRTKLRLTFEEIESLYRNTTKIAVKASRT